MSQEVTEETRETLHVIELDRTPRPQKMAAERAYFDGAHEVRYTERTFRPKHGADLDEVRAFVDSLEVRRREAPPLPAPPAPTRVPVAARVPDHYRAPLEAVIQGALISVETVHRVGTGTVVDVAWEARDEGERRGLFVIADDVARPFEDLASAIDALPAPSAPAAAAEPAAPAPVEEAPAQETPAEPEAKNEKKGLLGRFGRGKDAKPAPPPAKAAPPETPAPEAPAPKAEKKGLRGRFGRAKSSEAEPAEPASSAPPAEAPKKRRFGFGGK